MAEIHVERRPRPRLLPWLIGLVAVALILYLAVRFLGAERVPAEGESPVSLAQAPER